MDITTGRFYFGSSVDLRNRWSQHRAALRKGGHTNPILQNAWNAHGEEAFMFEVVELCSPTKEALLATEQQYIDGAGVGSNRLCMNVLKVAGSHLGAKRSEETIRRLSAANLGKTLTAEHRKKLREAKIGKPLNLTPEQRQVISERSKGRPGPVHTASNLARWRKLDEVGLAKLWTLQAQGCSTSAIARELVVGRATVRRILKGESYKNGCENPNVAVPA